jgi:hypothetical protein
MAYLYRHIRLDKNQPFYIGISNVDDDYKRAYKRSCRNKHWTNIVKSTKYDVEILIDNLSIEQAKEKEKEFIALYGRVDLKSGCLVNLTDGGDGVLNMSSNSELRMKLSKAAIGKKMSESAKKKMGDNQKLPILQYDLQGNFVKEWNGVVDATKEVGKHSTNIIRCCQGKFKQAYGFIWKYKHPERMGRKPRAAQIEELKQLIKNK